MKRLSCLLFILITFFYSMVVWAENNNISVENVVLKINFDWAKPDEPSTEPIHTNALINLNAKQKNFIVVSTDTKLLNEHSFTRTLLVKPINITEKNCHLKFEILEYGVDAQKSKVVSQPEIILNNGQTGTVNLDDNVKITVTAVWPKTMG